MDEYALLPGGSVAGKIGDGPCDHVPANRQYRRRVTGDRQPGRIIEAVRCRHPGDLRRKAVIAVGVGGREVDEGRELECGDGLVGFEQPADAPVRGAQVTSVGRVGPIAYADPRAVGGVVDLEVETMEGPCAAFIEQADGGLDDVAVVDHLGCAHQPGLLGNRVASTERDYVLVVDPDLGIVGPVGAVLEVAGVDVDLHRVFLPRVRGRVVE